MENTEIKKERAVLAGLSAASMDEHERSTEVSMEELAALVETAGGETVAMLMQSRPTPDARSFIGDGKVREMKELIAMNDCDLAVFDNELSPSQMRVLSEELGVKVLDRKTGQTAEYRAQVVVNAGGIWGHDIARKAGVTVNMLPAKGSLLIFGHRVNNIVLNRCRKPADADILVPGDTISLIGTTSSKVPFDEVDDMYVTADEVDLLLREGMKLAPSLEHTRILRAYAGVRPLVASDDDPSGRSVSRGIVVLDHATRDGLEGFVTITGGKLMTYRLMAEWTTDLICKKLNLTAKCTTAEEKLPGSREPEEEVNRRLISVPVAQRASSIHRHGDMAGKVAAGDAARRSLVCECEEVSVGEVEYALNELDVNNLVDLRRRTRVGMGTCQGELCACRAAGLMAEAGKYCVRRAKEDLTAFLNERWKGMAPVAWGDTLRESEFTMWLYDGVCGLTSANNTK